VRTLGQIPQLSDFERGRILEITKRIGRSVGTILRCCQKAEHRARGTGRRRMTTRESRSIKGCLPFFVTYYTGVPKKKDETIAPLFIGGF
jgi:hypothetical protein